jgi:hypothetical protein
MRVRTSVIGVAVLVGMIDVSAQAPRPSDPWFRRSTQAGDFQPARLPWKTFAVELPKDWQLGPGVGATLFWVTEEVRGDLPAAGIVFEHTENVEPLNPNDVDAKLAGFEAEYVRRRDPGGSNFEQEAKDVDGRRFILVRYSRAGFTGPDRVVVYVVPAGKVMYRLFCIAPEKQFNEKYQEIFAHVAASFKPSVAN